MVILKLYVQIGWYQNIGFLKWAPKDIKDIVNVGTKAIELGEFWTGKLNYEANWWCLLYQKRTQLIGDRLDDSNIGPQRLNYLTYKVTSL